MPATVTAARSGAPGSTPSCGSTACGSSEELVELRDRDLSFSAAETKDFLASFDVELSEGRRRAGRTTVTARGGRRGCKWRPSPSTGSPDPVKAAGRVELHRHTVAGYFLDEVLYRQPPEIVDFMLTTSVAR